jgi:hypothetical protein
MNSINKPLSNAEQFNADLFRSIKSLNDALVKDPHERFALLDLYTKTFRKDYDKLHPPKKFSFESIGIYTAKSNRTLFTNIYIDTLRQVERLFINKNTSATIKNDMYINEISFAKIAPAYKNYPKLHWLLLEQLPVGWEYILKDIMLEFDNLDTPSERYALLLYCYHNYDKEMFNDLKNIPLDYLYETLEPVMEEYRERLIATIE